MSLLKRFGFFFFGLALGSIIVMFFFQRKGTEFCYLPNCRVLKNLRSKPLTISPEVQSQGYTMESLSPIFKEGNVDFSRSDTQSACRTYIIQGKDTQQSSLEITVENCTEKATVKSVTLIK
ncbi:MULTISPECIES: hypothetical protein [unclassified Capnocytophaga]|jgi:hypothetical protein|uniref:hypothetical protein n=1 Tax=unclassified Capnocytophaga TaxID=2640652 RepID=UPI000202D6E3|nr:MULTISPECIES: hypothetical protein [unclassified Capnocytophaga]EGD33363.1 hypothetical protein HMPREF9071_2157 [Capnocytophaga sp. oral taxon 338 str. F0234]MEB3004114.1 hypothetical protein [Capnocytophaga sp. G2]